VFLESILELGDSGANENDKVKRLLSMRPPNQIGISIPSHACSQVFHEPLGSA
jgi:hypothetical protein